MTFRVLHKDVMNGMFEDHTCAQWGEPKRQMSPNTSWAANQCLTSASPICLLPRLAGLPMPWALCSLSLIRGRSQR